MVQTKRPRSRREMPAVHPDAAAIDVGATMHVVAVPPDRDPEPVRTFGTFTADLHRLADWLRACRIKSVVMESTGVYWIPIFEILEQKGFDVQIKTRYALRPTKARWQAPDVRNPRVRSGPI